jgi:hypothetical protein
LLPTRGGFGPGLGPAGAAGDALAAGACGRGRAGAGLGDGVAGSAGAGAGAGAAAAAGFGAGVSGTAGAAGAAGAGRGPGRGPPDGRGPAEAGRAEPSAELPFLGAPLAGAAGALDANDSRRRRATGASTVDDADFTNSPCSLSVASSSLLVTPSSFANSCTRALPATALLTERSSVAFPVAGRPHDLGLSPTDVHRWCFTLRS